MVLSQPDDEEKLSEDYELQAWGLELVADGNPGCGIKVTCKVNVLFSKISLLTFVWYKFCGIIKVMTLNLTPLRKVRSNIPREHKTPL